MTLVLILKMVWMFCAVGIIVLVLLHSPKGDGLSGLGGQAQLFTSTKSAETTLNRSYMDIDCSLYRVDDRPQCGLARSITLG